MLDRPPEPVIPPLALLPPEAELPPVAVVPPVLVLPPDPGLPPLPITPPEPEVPPDVTWPPEEVVPPLPAEEPPVPFTGVSVLSAHPAPTAKTRKREVAMPRAVVKVRAGRVMHPFAQRYGFLLQTNLPGRKRARFSTCKPPR
jgi:hypothetical protein